MSEDPRDRAVAYVEQLHRAVDELVAPIGARLGDRLMCRMGCSGCCTDGLTIFEVEAELIQRRHPDALLSPPAPAGQCAMLTPQGACRVYAARPYVCRTQGYPLRWAEDDGEKRDICPLNDDGSDLTELPDALCWTLGPIERRLASAQALIDGGEGRRVAIRDLFGE